MRSLMVAVLVVGCGGTASGVDRAVSAREELVTPQAFAVVPSETSVELDASVDRGDAHESAHVTVPVVSGGAVVSGAGDQLELRELTIDLAPVDIPESILTGGVRLVDVHLRLAAPVTTADATWSDDDEHGGGSVRASLVLSWSVAISGRTFVLADQRIDDLAIAIGVDRSGDALTFDAGLIADGARWSWADLVFFGDVAVTLHAEQ
ncbi:MAG TPA: hypothetical protein VL463_02520 [Kofleriaceae bacterium]|nr:hypothetical protein [Kofleriaceae bacterium]